MPTFLRRRILDSIASLGELDDRAQFKIAGAIVEVEKKFTKKEGKPFAVVWLEDLMDMLEVVVWNEVYLKVSDILVPGRVVELKATLDRRDEMLRATAVEIKPLAAARPNGASERSEDTSQASAIRLRFLRRRRAMSCVKSATFSSAHPEVIRSNCYLIEVTAIRCGSMRALSSESNVTPDSAEKLSRWLVTGQRQ